MNKKILFIGASVAVGYYLLTRKSDGRGITTADNEGGFINSLVGGFMNVSETAFISETSLQMNFSIQLLEYLKSWEKFSSKAYYATAAEKDDGKLTIGYGHLIIDGDGLDADSVLTETEATGLLLNDIAKHQIYVNRGVKVPLTQNQFDALVSFTFNLGGGAFGKSTMLKKLNSGDYEAVPAQLMKWTKQGGAVLQGLVNRRASEVRIWDDADYKRV